jgi:C-methyltransferase C-terminal domain/Putative zinc binding domain/Methyltransferase domain
MNCRFCKHPLTHTLIDLVNSPASNSFLSKEQLNEPEIFYPLKVFVCDNCFLVQVDEYKKSASIFDSNYAYFSSYSTSWLQHAKTYTEAMTSRFGYDENSLVIEVASNDGYLLQYFKEKNIPVMGIEPSSNTAEVAIGKGIKTVIEFFGEELADRFANTWNVRADLLLGNNVLAHVPDIVDFVSGMKIILKDSGVVTMEFPHLMQLVDNNQFDTIYHEHFSYLSLYTVEQIFGSRGLVVFDVDEIPTHGGSLRIYAKHSEDESKPVSENVAAVLKKELDKGLNTLAYYDNFQRKALQAKLDLTEFLIDQKRSGGKIAAYGAAAKGNTLLNYCGIKSDLISFVVDANPHKQGKYLPGSHIPVFKEDMIKEDKPGFILILPWNLKDEIINQLYYIKEWGGKFVVAVPGLQII